MQCMYSVETVANSSISGIAEVYLGPYQTCNSSIINDSFPSAQLNISVYEIRTRRDRGGKLEEEDM